MDQKMNKLICVVMSIMLACMIGWIWMNVMRG
jgi:hypothetical protein